MDKIEQKELRKQRSKSKFIQSRYVPKNIEKYNGNPRNIFLRSSWERKFAIFCDKNENVLNWSYESMVIPYKCPTDNKLHRYFLDFKIKVREVDGSIRDYLIEIKPHAQTEIPKFPGRKTKRYINEALTYAKNQAKWCAANKFAEKMNYKFKIINEYDLGIKKRSK